MDVRIVYCHLCYRERAESLAKELGAQLGTKVEVVEGKLGQFDVLIDGEAD